MESREELNQRYNELYNEAKRLKESYEQLNEEIKGVKGLVENYKATNVQLVAKVKKYEEEREKKCYLVQIFVFDEDEVKTILLNLSKEQVSGILELNENITGVDITIYEEVNFKEIK